MSLGWEHHLERAMMKRGWTKDLGPDYCSSSPKPTKLSCFYTKHQQGWEWRCCYPVLTPAGNWEFSVSGIWSVPEFGRPRRKRLRAGARSWLAPPGVCGILISVPSYDPKQKAFREFQVEKTRRLKWREWWSQNALKGMKSWGKSQKTQRFFVLGLLLLLPRSPESRSFILEDIPTNSFLEHIKTFRIPTE